MRIKDLCIESHDRAVRKGHYDPPPSVESRLCLIHSEVSEALEAYRDDQMTTTIGAKGKPEGLPSELADIIIRVCDFARALGVDLEHEIRIGGGRRCLSRRAAYRQEAIARVRQAYPCECEPAEPDYPGWTCARHAWTAEQWSKLVRRLASFLIFLDRLGRAQMTGGSR